MKTKTTKNIIKFQSYKFAFERMEEAIQKEFFLESIMIAESIISDRLLSYLVVRLKESGETHQFTNKETFLGRLIQEWKRRDEKVPYKTREDLIDAVRLWSYDRNECAHGLVKSRPGDPTTSVEEFTKKASNCAVNGKQLARDICSWTQSKKSKIRKTKVQAPESIDTPTQPACSDLI
ncbi:hypothetical protein [Coleofasciculus sp. FACHB-129]|uniref:hypothetical protein n=1 Tax=Cyanophyceae TaxID=3028117 RepID=UPI0016824E16|nr:hypothetical protein [Coleofasciculus sp. FACHB-129]MBD1895150.1 hypothetical protein [Coleofasciculus sp. FACHB-129]